MSDRDDLEWLYGPGENRPGPADTRPMHGGRGEDPRAQQSAAPRRSRPVPPVDPNTRPAPAPRAREPQQGHDRPGHPGQPPYGQSQYGRSQYGQQPGQQYGQGRHGAPPPAPGTPPPAPPPPPMSSRRRPQRGQRRPLRRPRGRGGRRRTIRTVLALMLAYLLVFPAFAWFGSQTVSASPEGDRPGRQPGITLILAGSDSREGLDEDQRKEFGTGTVDGHRADTLMLLHVPVIGAPMLVSMPRDSYVEIPGHGMNKINAAYALGGPELLTATVEENTGVRVDGFVEIGFGGFVNIIDAVGGVEMCLDQPMQDRDAHIDLPAGCQDLTGAEALGYVRMRKSDPRGDIGRAERQREMVGATVSKILSPLTVINPVRWVSINNAVRGSITRGTNTGPLDAGALVYGAAGSGLGFGHTFSVPVADTAYQSSAGSAVLWDEDESEKVFRAMRRGNTLGMGDISDGTN